MHHRGLVSLLALSVLFASTGCASPTTPTKPNIVVIMADDQDWQLGSIEAQPVVRQEMMAKGLTLDNHFTTIAQCCPSRVMFLRGQAGHNTNMTHIAPPGGAYNKFLATGEDHDYLPFWLNAVGYRTECECVEFGVTDRKDLIDPRPGKIHEWGKFGDIPSPTARFRSYRRLGEYNVFPKQHLSFRELAILLNPVQTIDHNQLNPYTYDFNNVVMSMNGERPVYYNGYHQTDVIRIKALDRLEKLTSAGQPFYIQIAPASPHQASDGPTVPLMRHMWDFNNATAPRRPNFNPPDVYAKQKPSYLGEIPRLNQSQIDYVDFSHRSRLQGLAGVDEIVQDVLELLEKKGVMDNTYIVYTSDNGYHEGQHRRIGGKGLPYIEDTNVPMIIRGPGIPAGKVNKLPSTHIDMPPTFLDMAGIDPTEFPVFFDGRSLLPEWQDEAGVSDGNWNGSYVAKEVLNIEFWGSIDNGASPDFSNRQANNSYKTVRLISEDSSWLFSRWCTGNQTELYNTLDDPYELTNLALNATTEHQKVIRRLNGLLSVTKSCSQGTCRDPWRLLATNAGGVGGADFSSLGEALDPRYDSSFESLPPVGFQRCMDYQYVPNEGPYYPPESASLGSEFRLATDNFESYDADAVPTPGNSGRRMGTARQRHHNLTTVMSKARNLTDAEIGTKIQCHAPGYCGAITDF
ncbi:hypothetical protein H2204_012375 [Knufia peltigerae]|uniref:Sulfatase N-terminal domain-containing protein n=1 Tax=Knufia peltigerae TaxID=1002370 RepID=A0AA38XSJ4_9EURO|nr:hypothetical protein H2204_012375 [Knufia peltigerae]